MDADHGARHTLQSKMLPNAQLAERHRASLEILRRISVEVLDKDARRLLEEAGAEVHSTRVRFPSQLAKCAIQVTPRVSRCATAETARPASTLRDSGAVGSEEVPDSQASLRPPPKPSVRISRTRLSQRCIICRVPAKVSVNNPAAN
jgi:hypothetical protein